MSDQPQQAGSGGSSGASSSGASSPGGSSSGVRSSGGTSSWRRWLWPLLFLSLALNLLVIGMVAGFMLRHKAPPGGFRGAHLLGYVHSLPADRRREMVRTIREDRRALRNLRRETRRARADAAELLGKAPYDATAYSAALAISLTANTAMRRSVHALSLKVARSLTGQERAEFAKWRHRQIRQRRKFRRHMRGRRGTDGDQSR